MKRVTEWLMSFRNFRTRLLAWYFLLAVSTTVMATWVTRQIYCDRLYEQAEAALAEEVTRFQQAAEPLTARRPTEPEITALFDQMVAAHVPAEDEWVATFVDGELYRASGPLPDWLVRDPDLVTRWANLSAPQQQRLEGADHNVVYAAEPLIIGNEVEGIFIAVEDKTTAYLHSTGA